VPASVPAHTTAGTQTSTALQGLPPTASVELAPSPAQPGVDAVSVVGSRVVVTPSKTFSGVVTVPVLVRDGDATVETTVSVIVRPAPVTHVEAIPASADAATRIVWRASPSARGYEVTVDGHVVCRTTGTSCNVRRLLTAGSRVAVTALGNASTRSVERKGTVTAAQPQLIATVPFATASARLTRLAKRTLDAAQAKIRRYRWGFALLSCHTDNAGTLAYNFALSRSRCESVARYVKRHLGVKRVHYRESAFGFLRPSVPNTSSARMAKNRRVEIWVK
jgi:outer membrane protein OmpA-like peptidoglycan-associated protein